MAIEPRDSGRAISIHALREEGDAWRCIPYTPQAQFLSTPSARRATGPKPFHRGWQQYFYPRPPRGGRQGFYCTAVVLYAISIHALREEGDAAASGLYKTTVDISIHALREEGDIDAPGFGIYDVRFLSTPSARRATTVPSSETTSVEDFYPRPPRGGRPPDQTPCSTSENFYPRPPRGGRPFQPPGRPVHLPISIHALREEGDPACPAVLLHFTISIHALREEGDAVTA